MLTPSFPAFSPSRSLLLPYRPSGGLDGIPLATWYAAAKHGVMGYWAALCAEVRQEAARDGGEAAFRCVEPRLRREAAWLRDWGAGAMRSARSFRVS